MVIYSNEIKFFLDKVYFYELTHKKDFKLSLYNYYEEKLYNIPKLTHHEASSVFPMSRDGLFSLTIGRLTFGYSYDGENICVEYYINRKPQNDWFDWLIKESQASVFNNTSKNINIIHLNESDLKEIIVKTIKRVLQESQNNENVHKVGNWDCVPSNGYEFHNIPNKGMCLGIAMYMDNTSNEKIPPTYCLFRRGDNGKYFYATIINAPEREIKGTKFSIVPVSDVPQEIYRDRYNLNLLS